MNTPPFEKVRKVIESKLKYGSAIERISLRLSIWETTWENGTCTSYDAKFDWNKYDTNPDSPKFESDALVGVICRCGWDELVKIAQELNIDETFVMTSREYEDQSSDGGIKLAVLHLTFERKK